MTTVYIVGLLLITVVAANIIHLRWPSCWRLSLRLRMPSRLSL